MNHQKLMRSWVHHTHLQRPQVPGLWIHCRPSTLREPNVGSLADGRAGTGGVAQSPLLSCSDCCRMVGEGKAGAGQAAVDEVGAELDMTQAPAQGAFEVLVVGEGGVGQRAAP